MSTSGDTTKTAMPGTGGARDGLKGFAFKAGKDEPEQPSAVWAWDAPPKSRPPKPPESAPPESRTEGTSAPARTRNARRRQLWWVDLDLVLAASVCVFVAAVGWRFYSGHLPGYVEAVAASPAAMSGADRSELSFQLQLEQERALRQELEQRLAARPSEEGALAQERLRTKELEGQLAARQNSEQALMLALAQERARSQALERELATRTEAKPAVTSNIPAPPADDERVATPAPAAVSTPIPVDKMARTEPPAPQAADAEVARLMERAERLLEEGDVGTARILLERAAEAGSPLATFMLAESYNPTVLFYWSTVGTRGDVAKAQQLYAKAAADGVEAAKDRLKTLRSPGKP
jgi:TPR repeat protein